MTETKLLPCPFCGGKAVLEKMGWPHRVCCTLCGAQMIGKGLGEDGERDAIAMWNIRYPYPDTIATSEWINKQCEKLAEYITALKTCTEDQSKSYGIHLAKTMIELLTYFPDGTRIPHNLGV